MWKGPVLAILLSACHDSGRDTLAMARGQYDALRKAGTPLQSHDYDAVMKSLNAIPDSSGAKSDAQELRRSIEAERAKLPPLAPAAPQDARAETKAECDRLRDELKSLAFDARTRKQEVLDACERRLAELSTPEPKP